MTLAIAVAGLIYALVTLRWLARKKRELRALLKLTDEWLRASRRR